MLFSVTRGWVGVQFPGKKALRNTWMAPNIESFHPRQLRYALGIKYPCVITNQKLYDLTKCEPWSIVTERRRLSWLGHLIRLNPETPARQYFKEALRPAKRKPGRPPTTWITTIQKDPTERGIYVNLRGTIKELESMCHDRAGWKAGCSMRGTSETSPLNQWTSSCSWWWWLKFVLNKKWQS